MRRSITAVVCGAISVALLVAAHAQSGSPDWRAVEDETLRHYQALLRLDTSNPPGNEHIAAEYLKDVLDHEGIPAQIVGRDPNRPNLVARLKGNGKKRPLLIMGHTDVVTVDPAKWKFPPFSATRDGGYVYGRGTVDDKDNVTGRADDDDPAEAAQRAARPRRHLRRRGRRGGRRSRRHRLPGHRALSEDRRRVPPRRRRRRHAQGRPRRLRDRSRRSRRSRAASSWSPAACRATDRCRSRPIRSSISRGAVARVGEWRPRSG